MGAAASHPSCPRCGYDLTGLVGMWTGAWPLESVCSECGETFATGRAFPRPERGPPWSFEHASRRLAQRWVSTTAMTFRPARLWKELRPEHPVVPWRLAVLGLTWVAVLHLASAGAYLLSQLAMDIMGSWSVLSGWRADDVRSWMVIAWIVAWPHAREFEVPLDANTSFSDPMPVFIVLPAAPILVLAGGVWWWSRRWRGCSVAHLARALVMLLPVVTAWMIATMVVFSTVGRLESLSHTSDWSTVAALGLMAAYAAHVIWWWRCFTFHHAGRTRSSWIVAVLGLLSLPVGWVLGAAGLAALGW